jgi:hypothetical protein
MQFPSIRNYFAAGAFDHKLWIFIIASLSISLIVGVILSWETKVHFKTKILADLKRKSSLIYFLLIILILIAIAVFSCDIYQQKEGINRGGTGDDAMQAPILALFQGQSLYNIHLFDGAPISPGLGWLLLNAPFTLLKIPLAMNFVYFIIVLIILGLEDRSLFAPFLFTVATALNFSILEQFYSAHDLFAIGLSFLISLYFFKHCKRTWQTILLALLLGVFTTSRVIFILFPPLLGLIYFPDEKKKAFLISLISPLVAAAVHTVGILTSDFYQPLHIFLRGRDRIPVTFTLMVLVITLGLALFYWVRRNSLQNRLFWLAVLFLIPLLGLSIGELIGGRWRLAEWEASRYLLPALPIWYVLLIKQFKSGKSSKTTGFSKP